MTVTSLLQYLLSSQAEQSERSSSSDTQGLLRAPSFPSTEMERIVLMFC